MNLNGLIAKALTYGGGSSILPPIKPDFDDMLNRPTVFSLAYGRYRTEYKQYDYGLTLDDVSIVDGKIVVQLDKLPNPLYANSYVQYTENMPINNISYYYYTIFINAIVYYDDEPLYIMQRNGGYSESKIQYVRNSNNELNITPSSLQLFSDCDILKAELTEYATELKLTTNFEYIYDNSGVIEKYYNSGSMKIPITGAHSYHPTVETLSRVSNKDFIKHTIDATIALCKEFGNSIFLGTIYEKT